ncbi:hypothetical protein DL766_007233 [Monosporascus sp. MC13-8B]|uniref:Uncharacterized protein n=1 Tax=Monosporascus cannonballus TaxID=155416 RepID=A0ABY0HMT8_9PEZI|nr:hypothetical protein DL763_005934 [Monosporascus cannonballus]RYO95091.1 hypothetical protein DL762_000284 [Monosporascus cannonballus]RYP24650.1 hypothetical protein DL766_007233 [Monosporascus sp. MC13-8B]
MKNVSVELCRTIGRIGQIRTVRTSHYVHIVGPVCPVYLVGVQQPYRFQYVRYRSIELACSFVPNGRPAGLPGLMLANHRNVSYGTNFSRTIHLAISRSKLSANRANYRYSSLAAGSRNLSQTVFDTGLKLASYNFTRSFPSKCFAQPISLTYVDFASMPPGPSAVRPRSSSSAASLSSYVANISSHSLPLLPLPLRLGLPAVSTVSPVSIAVPVAASAAALPPDDDRSTSNQPLAARLRKNLWQRTPIRHGKSSAAIPRPAAARPRPYGLVHP